MSGTKTDVPNISLKDRTKNPVYLKYPNRDKLVKIAKASKYLLRVFSIKEPAVQLNNIDPNKSGKYRMSQYEQKANEATTRDVVANFVNLNFAKVK